MNDLFNRGYCQFSACGLFRYDLVRLWDDTRPTFLIIMLNPSTADADKTDPTTTKCLHYANIQNCGRYVAVNLFGFRSPKPSVMKKATDPVGPDNDHWIESHLLIVKKYGGVVIVAWGNDGKHMNRDAAMMDMLDRMEIKPLCFGVNQNGTPKHPTYLAKNLELVPYAQ